MKSLPIALSGFALCALVGGGAAWQRAPMRHAITPNTAHFTSPPSKIANSHSITAISPSDATQFKELHVNEAGRVPILEYHEIGPNPPNAGRATRMMHRSLDEFQSDLQRLYEEGYRPVNLSEYLNNKMELPAGTSPVILTFDDARSTQFRYLSDGSIDPDCAIGIMQAFTQAHPDFPLKAMFYVLPDGAFGSDRYAAKKMRALLQMGCELGNHTLSHNYFNRMSDAAIIKEIARGKSVTEKMVPGAHLDTLALPGGCKPRSHNYGVLTSGTYNGVHYQNRAVIDAWGGPAPSPVSIKFDPLRIPRVLGVNGSDGVDAYLDALKAHPGERFVSDGDPNTITIPKRLEKFVNQKHLNGLALRTYDDGRKASGDEGAVTTSRPRHRKRRHTTHRTHRTHSKRRSHSRRHAAPQPPSVQF